MLSRSTRAQFRASVQGESPRAPGVAVAVDALRGSRSCLLHALELGSPVTDAVVVERVLIGEVAPTLTTLLDYYTGGNATASDLKPTTEERKFFDDHALLQRLDISEAAGVQLLRWYVKTSATPGMATSTTAAAGTLLAASLRSSRMGQSIASSNTDSGNVCVSATADALVELYHRERMATLELVRWSFAAGTAPARSSTQVILRGDNGGNTAAADSMFIRATTQCHRLLTSIAKRYKGDAQRTRCALLELGALLDIMILLVARVSHTSVKVVAHVQAVLECGVLFAPSATTAASFAEAPALIDGYRLKAAAVVVALLQFDELLARKQLRLGVVDEQRLVTSPASILLLDSTFGEVLPAMRDDPFVGIVWFAWAAFLSRVFDAVDEKAALTSGGGPGAEHFRQLITRLTQAEPSSAASVEVFKVYAQQGFQSGALTTMASVARQLTAAAMTDSDNKGPATIIPTAATTALAIVKTALARAVLLFTSTFELAYIADDSTILDAVAALLSSNPSGTHDLWKQPGRNSLKYLVEHALDTVPMRLDPFLALCTVVAQTPADAPVLFSFLKEVPVFTQDAAEVEGECAEQVAERRVEVVRGFNVAERYGGSPRFVIREGATGDYVVGTGGRAYVQWRFSYCFWDLAVGILAAALDLPSASFGATGHPLLTSITHLCNLLEAFASQYACAPASFLSAANASDFPRVQFADMLDITTRLVARCGMGADQRHNVALMERLMAAVGVVGCALTGDANVWSYVKQCNLVGGAASISRMGGGESGCLLRVRHVTENTMGKYPITVAFVRMTTLLYRTLHDNITTTIQAQLSSDHMSSAIDVLRQFIAECINDIAAVFEGWRYRAPGSLVAVQSALLDFFCVVLEDSSPLQAHRLVTLSASSKTTSTLPSTPLANLGALQLGVIQSLLFDASAARLRWLFTVLSSPSGKSAAVHASMSVRALHIFESLLEYEAFLDAAEPSALQSVLIEPWSDKVRAPALQLVADCVNWLWPKDVPMRATRILTLYVQSISRHDTRVSSLASILDHTAIASFTRNMTVDFDPTLKLPLVYLAATSLHGQPGIASIFLGITKASDGTEPKSTFLNTLVEFVTGSKETLVNDTSLLCASLLFFESLWKNAAQYQDILTELRGKSDFWTGLTHCLFAPLSNDNRRFQQTAIQARVYSILSMEVIGIGAHRDSAVTATKTLVDAVGQPVAHLLEKLKSENRLIGALKHLAMEVRLPAEARATAERLHVSTCSLDAHRRVNWLTHVDRCGNYGPAYAFATKFMPSDTTKDVEFLNMQWSTSDSRVMRLHTWINFILVVSTKAFDTYWLPSPGKTVGFLKELMDSVDLTSLDDAIAEQVQENVCKALVVFVRRMAQPSFDTHLSLPTAVEHAAHLLDTLKSTEYRTIVQDMMDSDKNTASTLVMVTSLLLRKISRASAPEATVKRLLPKLEHFFRMVAELLRDASTKSEVFERRASLLLYAIVECFGVPQFAAAKHLWKAALDRNDVVSTVIETLRLAGAGETLDEQSYRTAIALKLLLDFSAIPETAEILMTSGFTETVTHLPFFVAMLAQPIAEYGSHTGLRYSAHEQWCQIIDILTSLLKHQGRRGDFTLSALGWVDKSAGPLKTALGTSFADSSLSLAKLDELECITRLFYQLACVYPVWRRQRGEIARAYVERSLCLARNLIDVLGHASRFVACLLPVSTAEKNMAQPADDPNSPFHRAARRKALDVLKNILAAVNVFTGAVNVFTTAVSEWDCSQAVLAPVLEVSPRNRDSVSLGTLTNLLTYAKENARDADIQPVLATLVELGSILFVSQLYLHLEGRQFDMRQKGQMAVELGGELASALDALVLVMSPIKSQLATVDLLRSLRRSIDEQIRQ